MKAIRTARTRAGLTQKQLAELVGRDQSEISRVEAGKTALTVPLLLRIAKVLSVPPGRLLVDNQDDAQRCASAGRPKTQRTAKAG